jgi:hypothetical protein
MAIGVHGTGSDVLGPDDAISRDHHWGPRAAILLKDGDAAQANAIRQTLAAACQPEFEGHPVRRDFTNRTAVCVDHAAARLKSRQRTTPSITDLENASGHH